MKSRATNVWSCADEGDAVGVQKALRLVPHAVNILGWSYFTGKKRGVRFSVERNCFELSDARDCSPATILHIACVKGDADTAVAALSHGASVQVALCDCSPPPSLMHRVCDALHIARTNVAAGVVSEDFVKIIEAAAGAPSTDKAATLMQEETFRRSLLQLKCDKRYELLHSAWKEGVVEVVVEVRGLATIATGNSATRSRSSDPGQCDEAPDNVDETAPKPLQPDEHVPLTHRQEKTIVVRRCVGKAEFLQRIRELVGQAATVSFVVPTEECSLFDEHDGVASVSAQPLNATMGTSGGERTPPRRRRENNATRMVEVNSRNLQLLLCRGPQVRCVARPLLRLLPDPIPEQPKNVKQKNRTEVSLDDVRQVLGAYKDYAHLRASSPNGDASVNETAAASDVSAASTTGKRKKAPPTPVDELRYIVAKHEASVALNSLKQAGSTIIGGQRVDAETVDAMVSRLYDHDVSGLKKLVSERQQYIAEGAARLTSKPKRSALTPELEESVSRLCYEGVAKKKEKLEELEAALLATVPRAKECALPPDEVEAARERLTTATKRDEELQSLCEKYHGDVKSVKKLSKSRLEANVASVYTKAMETKTLAMMKAEQEYGDFRSRKAPSKKITRDEEKAIGDRLSKKQ